MINKRAFAVKMNLPISPDETRQAERGVELFEELNTKFKLINNHLNIFFEPFSKLGEVDSNEVMKHRIVLRNFRDQAKKNFEASLSLASKASRVMAAFSSDRETSETIDSFLAQMKDCEKQFDRFIGLFDNISNDNFINSLLTQIDIIKNQITQLRQLVSDRIISNIEKNILGKKWTNDVVDENNERLYSKLPLLVQLYKERQQAAGKG